jgi:hypothetical protein
LYYRKEREFEETMDSLQNDIDSLESERGELKDKVKQMSKKVLIQGLTKSHSISDGKTNLNNTGTYRNNSVPDSHGTVTIWYARDLGPTLFVCGFQDAKNGFFL